MGARIEKSMNLPIDFLEKATAEHEILTKLVLVASFSCFDMFPEHRQIYVELTILADEASHYS